MALQAPFNTSFGAQFPFGLVIASELSPANDFEKSTAESPVQARDKDTGLLVWQFDVIDLDPKARERTFKVKIAAEYQPVPPDALPGMPFRPVVLDGLTVTPWIKDGPRPKIAYSVRCTGLSTPKQTATGRTESRAA